MYKSKADKVRPVDWGISDGSKPGGLDDWFEQDEKLRPPKPGGKFDKFITGRFSDKPIGYRLTKERFDMLKIGEDLTEQERELLHKTLTNREGALAFDWTELGQIREEVTPHIEIKTIPHEAWQEKTFGVPKALQEKVIEISLIDFFSGYDQFILDVKSRDMTAIQTPLGLLRMTRLPQGATNSIAQFVRVIYKILVDCIPNIALPYIDDVGVKGSRSFYNHKEVLPGIRRFIMEHIQNLDQVLVRFERAGATVGPKSQYCLPSMEIVDEKRPLRHSLHPRNRCQSASGTTEWSCKRPT
ncbi:unnamed protein product [Diplocarpon coronariae]